MVPDKSASCWKELLSGVRDPPFDSLATKLLVGRLRQKVRSEPGSVAAAVDEICHYFTANSFARRDLGKL
jgi:hypothetical protein